MSQSIAKQFMKKREKLNEIAMKNSDKTVKRFFSIDNQTYRDGALPEKTKELLGLVSSFVLGCDDCITYHLIQCKKHEFSTPEISEALSVAMLVGGTITIPHLRKAMKTWDSLQKE